MLDRSRLSADCAEDGVSFGSWPRFHTRWSIDISRIERTSAMTKNAQPLMDVPAPSLKISAYNPFEPPAVDLVWPKAAVKTKLGFDG
jgi:hypothetical protein